MAEIKVNSAGIREKAETFKALADSIRAYTEEMKETVNGLQPSWEGLASDNTRADFNKFQETFDEKYNTIIRFSQFLENTANEYERTEQANAQI